MPCAASEIRAPKTTRGSWLKVKPIVRANWRCRFERDVEQWIRKNYAEKIA